MSGKEKGAHQWLIEFDQLPTNIENFTSALDDALKQCNSDYEAKRYMNMTLNPPVVTIAENGLFYNWLKSEDKLGGQHKIPRLSNRRELIERLLGMNHSIVKLA